MATRKASGKTPSTTRAARIERRSEGGLAEALAAAPLPQGAAGASRARGLGVSPAVDAWLGLGFPRVILATGEPMEACATVAAFRKRYPTDAYVLPREAVAMQYALEMSETPVDPAGPLPEVRPLDVTKAARDVLRWGNGRVLQQLEVLCGAAAVAEATVNAIVSAAETPEGREGLERAGPAVVSAGLAWLLWRVHAPLRDRLRATLETAARGGVQSTYRFKSSLDVMLHGRAGVERSGSRFNGTLHLSDLVFADDDPEWAREVALERLAKLRPVDREWFDPQLVVLAGRDVLEAFRAGEGKFQKCFRQAMREELALFR